MLQADCLQVIFMSLEMLKEHNRPAEEACQQQDMARSCMSRFCLVIVGICLVVVVICLVV